MIKQIEVTLPAPSGNQTRTAYVYLPKAYDEKKRFPVLYMFDGQTAFFDDTAPYGDSWRMGEILDKLQAEIIVVAVEADREDRLTEYSPFPFQSKYGSSEGKGEAYMDWLVGTFKPMIDATYRTLSEREHTLLVGSSMGGLMTMFALCRYSAVFGGGAALSPSFWVAPEKVGRMIKAAEWTDDVSLYIDYGTEELRSHGEAQCRGLESCIGALLEKNVPFDFRLIPHGQHNEKSWRERIPNFLQTLKIQKGRPQ